MTQGERPNSHLLDSPFGAAQSTQKFAYGAHRTRRFPLARRDDTSSAGHRILCVDDDLGCLQLRQTLLESKGYAVIISDRPLEALKQDFDAVDLAFVDYDMPEMNGRDLLLKMRASNATFPIILLSGQAYALPVEVRVLFSACIDKGSPVREMLEIIERFRTQREVKDGG